jgi:hypothetical protein
MQWRARQRVKGEVSLLVCWHTLRRSGDSSHAAYFTMRWSSCHMTDLVHGADALTRRLVRE